MRLLTGSSKAALKIRAAVGSGPADPVNAFEVADKLGFEVRFVDLPSVEGMYANGEVPTIVISSLRPLGRQMFTCAHEIGHHALKHGAMIDSLVEAATSQASDPREREADNFAGYLLMPPTAIDHAFKVRGLSLYSPDYASVYRVASYFQVGYSSLITHLLVSLRKITLSTAQSLLRYTPSQIRKQLLGFPTTGHLAVLDKHWSVRVPLECHVGDHLLLPGGSIMESGILRAVQGAAGASIIAEVLSPGSAFVQVADGPRVRVRVAAKAYVGRLPYRWEPEAVDDE